MTRSNPSSSLTAMTIRLESVIFQALEAQARRAGQEMADYATGLITHALLDTIQAENFETAVRLRAEQELKTEVIRLARHLSPPEAFDPNVTLKVFQAIRTEKVLQPLYLRAIGDRPGDERGNPLKARINRMLGATIKTAVDAQVDETRDGNPIKVQVSGELIFSYTLLRQSQSSANTAQDDAHGA